MKPFLYSILFLISISTSFSQTEELVLKKSFEVDQNTVLNLDIDNATIQFVESTEDKIHIDYSILFNKNSEEIVYKAFKDLSASATKSGNTINLEVKNSMFLGELYYIEVDIDTYKKHIKNYFRNIKSNKLSYKSKDSLLKEIHFSSGPDSNDYFRKLKRENPNKHFGKLNRKFKQKFVIKAPKYLALKIKALRSKINFNYDVLKPIELNSFNTYLKFKKLENSNNKFSLYSGIFQSEKVVGGTYFFKDVSKVKIGSISNTKIDSETSKLQFGEISKKVKINDFNSKLYFYNLSKDFKELECKGEYSKMTFYGVKKGNYSMSVLGHNTVLNLNEMKTTFGLSKDKKLEKILEKKVPEGKISEGNISLVLTNGILNLIKKTNL